MGSRRPTSARCASLLLYCHGMKLLSVSSWNSTTGSLELGKKDFHAKYIVKEQLGKGGFGVVYSAERRSDGMEVAVKEVSKDAGDDGRGQHSFGGRSHAAASRRSRSDQAARLL